MVKAEIEKIMPDIIVCDFWTKEALPIADELGIPSVVNLPLPGMLQMLREHEIAWLVRLI